MNNKGYRHPIYIAVAEIQYNNADKFVTVVCKTFTDDLESGLQKQYRRKITIDEASPDLKNLSYEMEAYIKNHLQIKINGKKMNLVYTSFKKENNATWNYFKVNNIDGIEKLEVTDSILFEVYNNQVELIYATINGNRKNRKLTNPQNEASFDF